MGNIFTHLPFSVSISIAELYFCKDKLTITMEMEVLEECGFRKCPYPHNDRDFLHGPPQILHLVMSG